MTLLYILLIIIAFILWKIYRQRESEKEQIANEKIDAEWEAKKKEEFKDYPNLWGKLEGNWLEVFANQHKRGLPLLKIAFLLMLEGTTKFDLSEGSLKYDTLWDCSEELLEHLEKYHEGSAAEREIAMCTYWQIAAGVAEELTKENKEVAGKKLETEPFTNIEKIANIFPKKTNHPSKEITFFDEKGSFPRESKGSALIDEKIKALGL